MDGRAAWDFRYQAGTSDEAQAWNLRLLGGP